MVMGVGNPLRRDDAAGLELVRALKGRVPEQVLLVECGPVPENFLGPVLREKPTHVLLVDVALIDGPPGRALLLRPEDERVSAAISTHKPPVRLIADFIRSSVGAEVAILAIKPLDIGLGEGLSPELEKAITRLAGELISVLRSCFGSSRR